jgi:hypothetical protein
MDGSSRIVDVKDEAIAWIGEQVIDRILKDGDSLTIWSAGPKARVLLSETLEGANGKDAVKTKLNTLDVSGEVPDFSGALKDAVSRAAGGNSGRIKYTLLISASAESLAPALTGRDAYLFRWSKVEEYSRFMVLVVAPDIHNKVRQSAAAYMAGR